MYREKLSLLRPKAGNNYIHTVNYNTDNIYAVLQLTINVIF